MEYNEEASVAGRYQVFVGEQGQEYIVLDGLRIEDAVVQPPPTQIEHTYYEQAAPWYWVLFAGTLLYVAGVYLVLPLATKLRTKVGRQSA